MRAGQRQNPGMMTRTISLVINSLAGASFIIFSLRVSFFTRGFDLVTFLTDSTALVTVSFRFLFIERVSLFGIALSLSLNQFLLAMKELTECISTQFSCEKRKIATEPMVKKSMMYAAALMHQDGFKCFKAKNSTADTTVFLVPSHNCEEVNANENYYRSLVKRQWQSFDEFLMYGFQMFYIVKFSREFWNSESTCSCVCFFKENICKHIIAVGMREKIIECPDAANPTSLSQYKRKAGPTQKAKKALVFQ